MANIVFNSLELLEMIILNLLLQDIRLAQRINWTWKNVISSSPELQQALFLRPCTTDRVRFKHNWSNILNCRSQAQCDRFTEWDTLPDEEEKSWVWAASGRPFRGDLILNPFLADRTPLRLSRMPKGNSESASIELSWKRMLLTQPPLVELVVDHGTAYHWHSLKATEVEAGLTGIDVINNMLSFNELAFVSILKDRCIWFLSDDSKHPKLLSGIKILQELKSYSAEIRLLTASATPSHSP